MEFYSWIRSFGAMAGCESLTDGDIDEIEQLAVIVELASDLRAALLTCWLAGRAGLTPSAALVLETVRVVAPWSDESD